MATTTNFGFCLISLFSADHSRLGQVTQWSSKKELWWEIFYRPEPFLTPNQSTEAQKEQTAHYITLQWNTFYTISVWETWKLQQTLLKSNW